ncbi:MULTISPECIES: ATP-binding protein [Pseudomonas]|uniref:ATP-binding protein n=1 Tax=Pseudomonas lurida TaxID=244566 RepID=A0ABY9FPF1_9PSED|nr:MULTISPECIES: ATP-binding protein [Pseudomonas]QDH66611.1 AAA family ATPase [Pseudomonas azotoformans]WLG54949.1 ATP-binding protein [Pseudomonas extremorientalis]WLH05184.1 ATP-binding protein [Pseudomonas lurida]
MTTTATRPLHLHTLDSLCADLIAGLSVGVGDDGSTFQLKSSMARGVLFWYTKNKTRWAANVQTTDVEAIVDAALALPASHHPAAHVSRPDSPRIFSLASIQAHQFAGLHHAGTTQAKPNDFAFNIESGVTLFEGYNGCGKTSLINSIIWALTGEVLRPQRPPESGSKDFDFEVDEVATHAAPPVVPLPDPTLESLTAQAIPVNTWVELVFEDQDKQRYRVRRSLRRVARNTLKEEVSGLDEMGLDPISTRVGTTIPGILPYVQVGSTSALGKAVSELTGMAPLVQLANHANKAKKKIDGDLTKIKRSELEGSDEAYIVTRSDLLDLIHQHTLAIDEEAVPLPSDDACLETKLDQLASELEMLKTSGLDHAKQVLGDTFDAQDERQRSDLMKSIAPALNAVGKLGTLPSIARLGGLTKLSDDEAAPVRDFIAAVRKEAEELVEIAAEPNKAARVRLYARVATWIREHPGLQDENSCAICGHSLIDVVDEITGLKIKDHINGAAKEGDYAGQTFTAWANHAIGQITTRLPVAIAAEVRRDLSASPTSLLRQAVVDELFLDTAFIGSLALLKQSVAEACDHSLASFPKFNFTASPELGGGRAELKTLNQLIYRVERALAYPAWRKHATLARNSFMSEVVGQEATAERETVPSSLMGLLQKLQAVVAAIAPVDEAAVKQKRLVAELKKRRSFEQRLKAYGEASLALKECVTVGDLAEQQVLLLQRRLRSSATAWRQKIYSSAFPSTSLELVDTRMSSNGELQLLVGANRLAAPAQHVSNASALRASLLGFYLAYWQYMLSERGGLQLLLLDDPQELLDGDNRDRLAEALYEIYKASAQLIITTHDTRFALAVARRLQGKSVPFNHQYVHPATATRGTIFLTPSVSRVQTAFEQFKAHPDDPGAAQDYLAECRVFLEGRMGDLFDDRAYPAAATVSFAPTLGDHLSRLRGLIKNPPNELFKSPIIKGFVNDHALNDGSATLGLLNKSHHRDKERIRPQDVSDIKEHLERLRKGVERAHEEFRTFNRREPLAIPSTTMASLCPAEVSEFRVSIRASLKAFVRGATVGDSQEVEFEEITSDWFQSKAFFYIRSNTLGFAGPQGSVAIVEIEASAPTDRQIVIARTGKDVFARRLLKPQHSEFVALAAETPDPRKSPPTQLLHENQLLLHPIVGMFFGSLDFVPSSKNEAVQVPAVPQIQKIQSAYRIKEDSAVPLALPDQIALGGAAIAMDEFDAHLDEYVALHLDDGSSLFKRVGAKLPAPLQHLRQFESIGGLGLADVLAVDAEHIGLRRVLDAVSIIGVLYR